MNVDGKKVPPGVMIGSVIMSIILTPIILFLLIFVIPPFWTLALVVIVMLSKKRK
jgi:hypothetical protein